MSQQPLRKVKCPQCGKDAVFAPENPFRPFCSDRCRLIDLGSWADESYRVPTQDSVSLQDAALAAVEDDSDLDS